jgi:outer membrane protein TolC
MGLMLLANQVEDDAFSDAFSVALDFDGLIEQIKLQDTAVNVTQESVEPASARRSAGIEENCSSIPPGETCPP